MRGWGGVCVRGLQGVCEGSVTALLGICEGGMSWGGGVRGLEGVCEGSVRGVREAAWRCLGRLGRSQRAGAGLGRWVLGRGGGVPHEVQQLWS